MRAATLALVLLSASRAAFAQAPSGQPTAAVSLAAMAKLDRWVGEWSGSGWSISQAGARTEFTLHETVLRKAGGMVLMAEGRGTSTSGAAPGTVTHDGLALVFYDAKAGRYRWYGYDATAGAVEADVRLVPGGFEWSIVPEGRGVTVRFTLTFDETNWREAGEASVDGKTWTRFMEMHLVR